MSGFAGWLGLGKTQAPPRIRIGEVSLPGRMESRHLALSGTTGSGKTVEIRTMLKTVRERGDSALIVDVGGELLAEFGRPDDVILSPVDGRSARWDPVAEMVHAADADRVALALIPPGGNASDEEWSAYARTLVCAVLRVSKDVKHLADLLFLMPSYSDPETGMPGLDGLLAGTPAAQLFAPGASRMLSSIRGIVGSRLAWLPYSAAVRGGQWTARNWAASLDDQRAAGRVVWLPVRADYHSMMAPFVAAVTQQSIVQILSQPINESRRVWLCWDELGAYPRVAELVQALTQGRKFGLRVCLGYQSVAQLFSRYGNHDAQTILSCIGTHLVLRQGDAQSAEWASRQLGHREVVRRTRSEGMGGDSSSETIRDEAVVLPAELMRLPDLQGYLKVPGDHPIARVTLPIPPRSRASGGALAAHQQAPWLAAVKAAAPVDSAPVVMASTGKSNSKTAASLLGLDTELDLDGDTK